MILRLQLGATLQHQQRAASRFERVAVLRGLSTHARAKEYSREAAGLPDFIEKWNRNRFYQVGYVGIAGCVGSFALLGPAAVLPWALSLPVTGYWALGLTDINQKEQTIRRNFPVLGRARYIFESIRPEIRQYFVESDHESTPFNREQRSAVYQRAKDDVHTQPFGTRRDVYQEGFEWINHSLWPSAVSKENERCVIGANTCNHPYSASLLNISAMSYGALSDNAVLALNAAAKMGNFYHNTGEGGISSFHLKPGGDIVWNIGTGYFGCRNEDGTFSLEKFAKNAALDQVKMIEIKLSQGAKPAHGGMLPGAKVTKEIAFARGIPEGVDCHSPARHSAFRGPRELMHFVHKLRETSGKPVGFKLCVGKPREFTALVGAMLETGIAPDFITVDGAEGGTGAAPREFTNHVGYPLADALYIVNQTLIGAGVRDRVKVICSGKVVSGFSMVRNFAIGADVCNSARGMMFSLGCIQALKCNTNKCPTGITTQDRELMAGLDPESKKHRVFNFHKKTIESCLDLIGAIGTDSPGNLKPGHVMRRTAGGEHVRSYAELYPSLKAGQLVAHQEKTQYGIGTPRLQRAWDLGQRDLRETDF